MATANLTPLTSIVSATGWTTATTTTLNASDNSRAAGGNPLEVILAELTDSPADYDTPNTITFGVEWMLSAVATRPKNLLLELVSADGLTVYASYSTPAKTTTTEQTDSSGAIAFTIAPSKAQLDAARLRITAQEGGGMADSATISIDHVTVALDYNAVAAPQQFPQSVGGGFGPSTMAGDLSLTPQRRPDTPSVSSVIEDGADMLVTASAFSDPDAGDTSGGRRWRVYQA